MDRIIVPELPLRAHVGVTEAERSSEQEILIDVELSLDLSRAGREDTLEHTVDYEQVCDLLAATVRARRYRLIEAIAEACAEAVLAAFPVEEARVRIRKPSALRARGAPWAVVEVARRRA
jgi:dihydroneopterin aldolase